VRHIKEWQIIKILRMRKLAPALADAPYLSKSLRIEYSDVVSIIEQENQLFIKYKELLNEE